MIKVLLLSANPIDAPLIIEAEFRAIDAKIRAADHRDHVQLIPHGAVRLEDIPGLLMRYNPHVVHFSGHGAASGIELTTADNSRRLVPPNAIADIFRALKDNVRVVLLNPLHHPGALELRTAIVFVAFTLTTAALTMSDTATAQDKKEEKKDNKYPEKLKLRVWDAQGKKFLDEQTVDARRITSRDGSVVFFFVSKQLAGNYPNKDSEVTDEKGGRLGLSRQQGRSEREWRDGKHREEETLASSPKRACCAGPVLQDRTRRITLVRFAHWAAIPVPGPSLRPRCFCIRSTTQHPRTCGPGSDSGCPRCIRYLAASQRTFAGRRELL
jgi:hypothetical protein